MQNHGLSKFHLLENGISYSIICDTVRESKASVEERLEFALRFLSLLSGDEIMVAYEDILPWRTGGAETYIATGQLTIGTPQELQQRCFIAKAVVTFPTRPTDAIKTWLERYALLTALGVRCPHLYAVHRGVLYQESLKHSLALAWQDAGMEEKINLSFQLAATAGVFDACGFRPIAFGNDMMVHNNILYIVDVGEDLGSWNFSSPTPRAYKIWRASQYVMEGYVRALDLAYQHSFQQARQRVASGALSL